MIPVEAKFAAAIIVAVLIAGLLALPNPGRAASVDVSTGASQLRVIDGDTFASPAGVKYRILGLDTPETFQARCEDERALGLIAKARLEDILSKGEVRIVEGGLDRYGRTLARVYVNGRDVSEIMIGEGVARPYSGGRRLPWC